VWAELDDFVFVNSSCYVLRMMNSGDETGVTLVSHVLNEKYSASHSRVAPKMLVYKKNKSAIHLHLIPVMKCGCVFWGFAKRKLVTRKHKIKKTKDGYQPACRSRCQSVVRRDERCLLAFRS
jgi:hypothetical protein